ncbi:hypothetical protein [Corynebacterium riegelii]
MEAISDRDTAAARDIANQHFSTAREIRMTYSEKLLYEMPLSRDSQP